MVIRQQRTLAYLSHVYPVLTQTFTVQEVRYLRAWGLAVDVISFKQPRPRALLGCEPVAATLPGATYLARVGARGYLRGIRLASRGPLALAHTLSAVIRAPFPAHTDLSQRLRSLAACARSIPVVSLIDRSHASHIHADFADDTATVAWIVHRMTGASYSFRSHTSFNPQLMARKVRDASLVLSISRYDRERLLEQAGADCADKIVVNYLGVNPEEWLPEPGAVRSNELIVCIGTLQEKKGQRVLVKACEILRRKGVRFTCWLVGDGPDRGVVSDEVARRGLGSTVEIKGYLDHKRVKEVMRGAAVVCLPCTVARNGDTDGIPVVLMEAMALGRPCVSTPVSGVPELIEDGVDGLLVPPDDAPALANAIASLLKDQAACDRLGAAAREKILRCFDIRKNAAEAAALLHDCMTRRAC